MENLNFYILTGGPGSGKSTVLDILSNTGFHVVEEAGRDIIQKQMATKGDAVPWDNTSRYARLMFLHSVSDFEEFMHLDRPCFFDRGIPDILGYSLLAGIPIPQELKDSIARYRYNTKVFIFPPWKDIYTNDTERKQDFQEATATYQMLKNVYEEYGYQTVTVPCLPPAERAGWIISQIIS